MNVAVSAGMFVAVVRAEALGVVFCPVVGCIVWICVDAGVRRDVSEGNSVVVTAGTGVVGTGVAVLVGGRATAAFVVATGVSTSTVGTGGRCINPLNWLRSA